MAIHCKPCFNNLIDVFLLYCRIRRENGLPKIMKGENNIGLPKPPDQISGEEDVI